MTFTEEQITAAFLRWEQDPRDAISVPLTRVDR